MFLNIKKNYKVLNKTYTPIRVYDELGNFYKDFPSHTAAAKEFNVLPSRIITCYSTQQRLFHKYIIRKYNPNIDKIEVKQIIYHPCLIVRYYSIHQMGF